MHKSNQVFLSAEWRDLVMLNYEVDPGLLNPYVPRGTSLDSFEGRTYLSLVGFRFLHTKLLGCFPVPFHTDFDEINLRFYVRRKNVNEDREEVRRGVVFLAEVVPRLAIATTARLLYGENYTSLPMRHRIEADECNRTTQYRTIEYLWKVGGQWCRLSAKTAGPPIRPKEGSLEQFITEHYWGYSAQRAGGCLEYHVSHVPWQAWTASEAQFEGDASDLYGSKLGAVLLRRPDSAFMAEGSAVTVFKGNRLQ
jgi:uncharacterized protein